MDDTNIGQYDHYTIEGKFIECDRRSGKLSILVTAPEYLKDRKMEFECSLYYYLRLPSSNTEWDDRGFFKNVKNGTPSKYEFITRKYMEILHKEQKCCFYAYALNQEGNSVKNRGVETRPDEYNWIYDPNNFTAEKWDTETIDDLVKEIRPSMGCVMQILKSYVGDFWKSMWKTLGRWCQTPPKKFWNWLKENYTAVIALAAIIGIISAALNFLMKFFSR